jgi:hypothetical protein
MRTWNRGLFDAKRIRLQCRGQFRRHSIDVDSHSRIHFSIPLSVAKCSHLLVFALLLLLLV